MIFEKKKKKSLRFHRQLTAAGSIIRQFTSQRHFDNFHVFVSLHMCQQQFSSRYVVHHPLLIKFSDDWEAFM